MKSLLNFVLICCFSASLFAENWTPFPQNQASWFEFSNEEHYSISSYYADSIRQSGDSLHYYFHLKYLNDKLIATDPATDITFSCLDTSIYGSPNWLARFEDDALPFVHLSKPISEWNGAYYFDGEKIFDASLKEGAGFFIASEKYSTFDSLYVECVEEKIGIVLDQEDSIKVFRLSAYQNGSLSSSDFDGFTYILSKNSGFAEFLPFPELLDHPYTKVKIAGYINEQNDTIGKAGWSIADFSPYEPGDVLYSIERDGNFISGDITVDYHRDSITEVNFKTNVVTYYFDRHTIKQIDASYGSYYYIDTIEESTVKRIAWNKTFNSWVQHGVYQLDLQEGACESLYGDGPNLLEMKIERGDFSFDPLKPVVQFNYTCLGNFVVLDVENYNYIIRPCETEYNGYDDDNQLFHSGLGMIHTSFENEDYGDFRSWDLLAYTKGNQYYNAVCFPMKQRYAISDSAVLLQKPQETLKTFFDTDFEGPGVVDGYFIPSEVPADLWNTPITITCIVKGGGNGFKKAEPWIFTQTVFVKEEACYLDSLKLVFDDAANSLEIDVLVFNNDVDAFIVNIENTAYGPFSLADLPINITDISLTATELNLYLEGDRECSIQGEITRNLVATEMEELVDLSIYQMGNSLQVETAKQYQQLTLYDLQGRQLYSQILTQDNNRVQIPTISYPKGLHLVVLEDRQGKIVSRKVMLW